MARKWATGVNRPDWNNTLRLTEILEELDHKNRDPMDVELLDAFHKLPLVRRAQLLVAMAEEAKALEAPAPPQD